MCAIGTVFAIPIQAQEKPKKVPARSISYTVPSGYAQVGNTLLYYYQSSYSIDVQGCFNGQYYGSTFSNRGYKLAMQVNNGSAVSVDCLNGTTIDNVSCRASIAQQGELARICYTVTNANEEDVVVSLGTHADVMIGNNDRAPISRRIDTVGNTYGVTMKDGNGAQLCVLFGSGLAGVTSVNDYWFGHYSTNSSPYNMVGNYSAGSYYMVENGSYDSGMGWCWKSRVIPAGASVEYSYLIGVGEVSLEPNSSFEVTPDDPEGWNDLSRPHRLTLTGVYESPAGLDGVIDYAVEDSEEWFALTDTLQSGEEFSSSLVAMFDMTKSTHVIRFRTKDRVGNTTMLQPIEYLDVSFHELAGVEELVYSGDSLYQTNVTCDLDEDKYILANYQNNTNAGTASFSVEGVFPYTIGRKSYSFAIAPQPLSGTLLLSGERFVYDGEPFAPSWQFSNEAYASLAEGQDYTYSWINNVLPGTGTLKVFGKNNYTGELSSNIFIDKAPLTNSNFSAALPSSDVSYDAQPHPATITIDEGVGAYTISYAPHDTDVYSSEAPVEEGMYDVYVSFAEGPLYYGWERTLLGSFTIYRFDEGEWKSLLALYSQLSASNPVWAQKWYANMEANGILSVGSLEGLTVEKGHIREIDFANEKISCSLSSLLLSFPKMRKLDIRGNLFEGDIQASVEEMLAYLTRINPAFSSELQSLDLSDNNLSGNIGLLAYSQEEIPSVLQHFPHLDSLSAARNSLDGVYPPLPASISTLDLTDQHIFETVDMDFSALTPEDIAEKIPNLLLYNHKEQSYNNTHVMMLSNYAPHAAVVPEHPYCGVEVSIADGNVLLECGENTVYYGESGDTLYVTYPVASEEVKDSYFYTRFFFQRGDANFVPSVDITDLQATINFIFDEYSQYPFNFTAADTYTDHSINVQDVVCTAQIILDTENSSEVNAVSSGRMLLPKSDQSSACARLYVEDGKLILSSPVPVSAFEIIYEGDIRFEREMALRDYDVLQQDKNGKSKAVAYSLAGSALPAGNIVIGECVGEQLRLLDVKLSDNQAQYIPASVGNTATQINGLDADRDSEEYYSVDGVRTNRPKVGLYIVRSRKDGVSKTKIVNHK